MHALTWRENRNIQLKGISFPTARAKLTALSFEHRVPTPQLLPPRPPFLQNPSPGPPFRGENVGLGLGGARRKLHPGLWGIECQQLCVDGGILEEEGLSRGITDHKWYALRPAWSVLVAYQSRGHALGRAQSAA